MTGVGLSDVDRFVVPRRVLKVTLKTLKRVGRSKVEGMIAWGGRREDGGTLRFHQAFMPAQTALQTAQGLLVHVDDEALHNLNVAFNESGLVLAGQAHSHPTDAYHSSTDDHLPIVTLLGGLSLVVPNFARRGFRDADSFAWYRLRAYGDWVPVGDETTIVVE